MKQLLVCLFITILSSSCSNSNKETIVCYPSGKIHFKGKIQNGKRTGQWICYDTNGESLYFLTYIEDSIDTGWGNVNGGTINLKRKYINGVAQLVRTFWYKDGKTCSKVNFVNNEFVPEGEEISYYKSGEIKRKVNYVNGKKDGEEIGYYTSGEICGKVHYADGKKDGDTIGYYDVTDSINKISCKLHYVKGLREGAFISYYGTGRIQWITPYVHDTVTGLQKEFFADGSIEYTCLWGRGVGKRFMDEVWYNPDGSIRDLNKESEEKERQIKQFLQEQEERQKKKSEPAKIYASDGQLCKWCGLGHYQNGFCNMCGAASSERTNESRATAPDCEMCNGTGWVTMEGGRTKVCPSCKGTGKQTY